MFNCGITGLRKANENACPSHLSTSTNDRNIKAVKKMILIIISVVADVVGISFGSCQAIFKYVLGMKQASAKITPKLQNFEQKQRRMDIVQRR